MKTPLLPAALLIAGVTNAQVTAPGLFDGRAANQVTAVTSAEVSLKPEAAGRFLRFYAERTGHEAAERFYVCLSVEKTRGNAFDITDLTILVDEKGAKRPVRVSLHGDKSVATARLALAELRESMHRDMTYTFQGDRSQIDVRLPPGLAPNFLAACERSFGSLVDSSMPEASRSELRAVLQKPNSLPGTISRDPKATPFGEYDSNFLASVERCWDLLLKQYQGTKRLGKVVLAFRLTYDGRITDMRIQENSAGEILGMLCQSAILNPAPYPPWPAQMRQTIDDNSREIRLTFHYNK